jgi:hypothetical protein
MNKGKFNKRKFLLRLICSPLWLAILLITHIYIAIKGLSLYLINGGELINHLAEDKESIYKIYNELKKQTNE